MEDRDIFEEVYMHPELLSLLAENLKYCDDIGEALRAVAAGDDKALMKTVSCTKFMRASEKNMQR